MDSELDQSDIELLNSLSSRPDLDEEDKAIINSLKSRYGSEAYSTQHPIQTAIESTGKFLEDTAKYNPLLYVGKGLSAVTGAAEKVAELAPGVKKLNDSTFGAAKRGYSGLGDIAQNEFDSGRPLSGLLAGSAGIIGGALSGNNIFDLGLADVSEGANMPKIQSAVEGIANKIPGESSVEGMFRSGIGRMGRGDVPFDELAQARSAKLREVQAQEASRTSLEEQKGAVLSQEAEKDLSRNQVTSLDSAASSAEDSLKAQLGAIKTEGPSRMQVGEDILSRVDKARVQEKSNYAFDERYQIAKEQGAAIPGSSAPWVIDTVNKHIDSFDNILKETGDAKLQKTLTFFKGLAEDESAPNKAVSLLPGGEIYTPKTVDFNTLLDNKRVVDRGIYDLYDPKTDSYSKNAPALIELSQSIKKSLISQAADNPSLMSDIDSLSSDYSAYKTKYNEFLGRLKGGRIEPSDVPDLLLGKQERILKTESVIGSDGLQVLRDFRTKQILTDIKKAASSGEDVSQVVDKHFSGKIGDGNKSLYSSDEIDAFRALGEHLNSSNESSAELKLAANKAFESYQKLSELPEPQPELSKTSFKNRRVSDDPIQNIGRRRTDISASDKLARMVMSHGHRIGPIGLLIYMHHPYMAAIGMAMGYGPEVMARAYIGSAGVRAATNTAIKSIGTSDQSSNIAKTLNAMQLYSLGDNSKTDKNKPLKNLMR